MFYTGWPVDFINVLHLLVDTLAFFLIDLPCGCHSPVCCSLLVDDTCLGRKSKPLGDPKGS